MKYEFSSNDTELLREMEDVLGKYLKAAGNLSGKAFNVLSQYNGLLWSEIEGQKKTLMKLIEVNTPKETVIPDAVEDICYEVEENIPYDIIDEEKIYDEEKKENGAVKLYDKIVDFLKGQTCDELHWVRVYHFKHEMENYKDFQIKYIQHKAANEQEKNYVLFGNLTKNYSIRKTNNEVLGDTTECFEYILNIAEKIGIDIGQQNVIGGKVE